LLAPFMLAAISIYIFIMEIKQYKYDIVQYNNY
jgi:hypothetical protein